MRRFNISHILLFLDEKYANTFSCFCERVSRVKRETLTTKSIRNYIVFYNKREIRTFDPYEVKKGIEDYISENGVKSSKKSSLYLETIDNIIKAIEENPEGVPNTTDVIQDKLQKKEMKYLSTERQKELRLNRIKMREDGRRKAVESFKKYWSVT